MNPADGPTLYALAERARIRHGGMLTILKFPDHWCIGFGVAVNVLHEGLARADTFIDAAVKAMEADTPC